MRDKIPLVVWVIASVWLGMTWFGSNLALFIVGTCAIYVLGGLSIILLLGAYSGVANYVGEAILRRRMRLAGRFLPPQAALRRIGDGAGTLIIERPTVGWNITRAWWTSEDVLATAPAQPSDMDSSDVSVLCRDPFTNWCYQKYTHLDEGSALLVAVYNGERAADRLLQQLPGVKRVELKSGFVIQRDLLDASIGPQTE